MSRALRRLQWIGIAVFAVSAFMPGFAFRIGTPDLPEHLQPGDASVVLFGPPGPKRVPAEEAVHAFGEFVSDGEDAFWSRRAIYIYGLLPIWVLALLLARRHRRLAGALVWIVTFGVIVLEAIYLENDYRAFLPDLLGRLETGIAWCVVVVMLVYRRPADRRLDAVEASVGSQAALGFVHGLTLPASLARHLHGQMPLEDGIAEVMAEFLPGFWIGMVGLVLVALPAYIGRRNHDAVSSEIEARRATFGPTEPV